MQKKLSHGQSLKKGFLEYPVYYMKIFLKHLSSYEQWKSMQLYALGLVVVKLIKKHIKYLEMIKYKLKANNKKLLLRILVIKILRNHIHLILITTLLR